MEQFFQEQLARIDRLLAILEADNMDWLLGKLEHYDIAVFACQAMWHLKDWIMNDPEFRAADPQALKDDIHAEECLLVCADLANGTKHLALNYPKTGSSFAGVTGLEFRSSEKVFKVFYYVAMTDTNSQFYWMELRTLLRSCREAWNRIIDKHWLSSV